MTSPVQGVTLTDLKEAEKVAGKAEPDKPSQQSGVSWQGAPSRVWVPEAAYSDPAVAHRIPLGGRECLGWTSRMALPAEVRSGHLGMMQGPSTTLGLTPLLPCRGA